MYHIPLRTPEDMRALPLAVLRPYPGSSLSGVIVFMDVFRNSNGKLLRCGYTTGSCAAAAAKGAAEMLLCQSIVAAVSLDTPKGLPLSLMLEDCSFTASQARCAVRKDAGDDPDVTSGILVYATVRKSSRKGVTIDGGEGVGRVTKPGLDQPIGAAAINATPRRMIAQAVEAVCRAHGYEGGMEVIVSIPEGEALASRTFNPRMGIRGGISVLGTSGIVEPMSSQALVDTIALELRQLAATGERHLLLSPGNYGRDFARDILGLDVAHCVSCANFIGDAIDAAVSSGFRHILLIGHVGKLVKLGIGQTNTHSAAGDGRMETLLACALPHTGDVALLRAIAECATTDAALALLQKAGIKDAVMATLGRRIDDTLRRRVPCGVTVGYLTFTNRADLGGVLIQSENASDLMHHWRIEA